MKRIITALVTAIIISSCGPSYNKGVSYLSPESLYGITDTVRGELLPEKLNSERMPFWMYKTKDGLLGTMPINNAVHLADTVTGKIRMSAGPLLKSSIYWHGLDSLEIKGEHNNTTLLTAAYTDYSPVSETLFVADVYTNEVSTFKVEGNAIIQTSRYLLPIGKGFLQRYKILDDTLCAVLVCYPQRHKLYTINTTAGIIKDSIDYRIFENGSADSQKNNLLSLDMAVSPDRKSLFISDRVYNILKKYNIDGAQIEFEKEYMFLEPHMKMRGGIVYLEDSHLKAEGNIFATNEYLYMISAPETVGEYKEALDYSLRTKAAGSWLTSNRYILVFDRKDMSFVKSYVMDYRIMWLDMFPDNKTFYATVFPYRHRAYSRDSLTRTMWIAKYRLP